MDVNISLIAFSPSPAMGLALVSNTHSPLLVFYQRLWGSSGEDTNRDVSYGHCESAATLIN